LAAGIVLDERCPNWFIAADALLHLFEVEKLGRASRLALAA
jgi:hypothetical protein